MRIINIEESKNIQLEILLYFDKFCDEHKLRYSLAYGTLLGAVRHNGFIPWDDDIDVCMPRDDYERFISIFPRTNTDKYNLGCHLTSDDWILPFAKIYDNRTRVIHKHAHTTNMGVFIDIFPWDEIIDDNQRALRLKKIRKLWRFINNKRVGKICRDEGLILCLERIAVKALFFMTPRAFPSKIIDKIAKDNKSNGTYLGDPVIDLIKKPIEKDVFDNLMGDYSFEGHKFKTFSDAEKVLSAIYGDWKKLPPIEARMPKHELNSYWL